MPTIKSLITTLQTYYDPEEEYVGEIMSTQEIVDQFELTVNQANQFITKNNKHISIYEQVQELMSEEKEI